MSKPSLRRSILVSSVQKLLPDGEDVGDVVMLWTRHRWFLPYAVLSAAVLYIVGSVSGIETASTRVALALGGTAVAGLATTNYWVLARTSEGLVLFRSSRVRHYAKAIVRRLDPNTELEMVGSTVVTSDWRIDGIIYTLTKRWEATMRHLATAAS